MSTETATTLWTYTATAKRLGLPTTSLRNMVARRTVPFIRIGPRTVRFEPSVVEAWLRARSTQPDGSAAAPTR
jgi:excisionase family DNA binding protein